jgi:hypothetical protein
MRIQPLKPLLRKALLPVISLLFCLAFTVSAKASYLLSSSPKDSGYLMAQTDSDDAYDPFSDYSEFDEASDEEADINFFRNGRFFTIGMVAGLRAFTDQLSNLYGSGPTYGIFLSYFFDLNLALQFGFVTGDYDFNLSFADSGGNRFVNSGNVSLTFMSFDLKYYFSTQNVTKGLADLNPYILGGVSQVYRTYTISGLDGLSRESVMGLDGGGGIEIPILRRKSYIGLQLVYHFVSFKDESTAMIGVDTAGNQIQTSTKPKGDTYDLLMIFGMNF